MLTKKGFLVVGLVLLVFSFAGLGVSASDYDDYKPDEDSELAGFSSLQAINPEVIGWLTLYDTPVDYPLLQSEDNHKYLSLDALGNSNSVGSIFLDYRSSSDFSDFNTIVYGHHVAGGQVFGSLKYFVDEDYFAKHRYGSIYYGGRERGLEILAILEADAYDETIYQPAVKTTEERQAYYQYLLSKAKHKRDVAVSASSKLVLLSTCYVDVTNGRHLLVAKITDKVTQGVATSAGTEKSGFLLGLDDLYDRLTLVPVWMFFVLACVLLVLALMMIGVILYLRARLKTILTFSRKNNKEAI